MNKKHLSMGLAAVLFASYTITAFSQAKPETLVRQRQAAMTLQGKYYYPIRTMAQGKIPYDANVVARNVAFLEALSKMPWDGFDPNTKGVKSGALPVVYTDTAKFQDAQKGFEGEVAKLASVSKGGAEAAVKAQILAIDKSCNNCHETFRERN